MLKILFLLIFLSFIELSPAEFKGTSVSVLVQRPGELIFHDEFDHLNTDIWQHEINANGGGNGEFQIYNNSKDNSFTKDGFLHISPTLTADIFGSDFLFNGTFVLENCTDEFVPKTCEKTANGSFILNPAISARLRTKRSFSFKYGRIEVRAKMPSSDWTWPAIWLLPEINTYGTHPMSGEIDLVESRGNRHFWDPSINQSIGSDHMAACLHFGPRRGNDGYRHALFKRNRPSGDGFDADFHRYQLEWTPEYISFGLDDEEIGRVTPDCGGFFDLGKFDKTEINPWADSAENIVMAPFDRRFYIILNVAVGGNTFFPDHCLGPYPKPWKNKSPNAFLEFWNGRENWKHTWTSDRKSMQVDYVRVWSYSDTKNLYRYPDKYSNSSKIKLDFIAFSFLLIQLGAFSFL